MLTPREMAADAYTRTRNMSRRVLGYGPEQNQQLRRDRIEALRRASTLLQAARQTPRFLVSEWDDAALDAAALVIEKQLATETDQLASRTARGDTANAEWIAPGTLVSVPEASPAPPSSLAL